MDVTTRSATADDLDELVQLAADAQQTPSRHVTYVPTDADAIEAEMTALAGWPESCTVAIGTGGPVGWLQAESDLDIGRVWWWGPFLAAGGPLDTALALYDAASARLDPAIDQEEMGTDERNDLAAELAAARGFRAEIPSAVLSRPTRGAGPIASTVRPLEERDADAVALLHDRLFPGVHSTGASLVAMAPGRHLLVADDGDGVTGYVAFEVQVDGTGYLDFLAVDPDRRRRGIAATLVEAACSTLDELDVARIHLTVRTNNNPARSLYERLGFVEERLIRPYRKGFSLQ